MKTLLHLLAIAISLLCFIPGSSAQDHIIFPTGYQPDTRIDNMGYWQKMAELGLVPVQPFSPIPSALYTGSKVLIDGMLVDDSPDVPVTTESSHQSENSIAVNPNDADSLLNSNNSGNWPNTTAFSGADCLDSYDGGLTWGGSIHGPVGVNMGDPAACINMNGRYFVGYIYAYGQRVAYSDDNGTTWTASNVANGSASNILDKNHLWVDNSPTSPYNGYLYNGWMENSSIRVSRSITNGTTWEPRITISQGTNAGSHNQGINFKTGPDGEVYATWAVYDGWPADEKAIGFARSLDGGISWEPGFRAFNNIRGIRNSGVTQNQRVNSFPSMACDISNSSYRGTIYIVWPNKGVPGINNGSGCDVYMIKSTDQGTTWSAPKRINQDPAGLGKQHYFPWITCDQANGQLSMVFYDNRNVPNNQCEAWMAWSSDGGDTWEEMKVSDVSWTPSPIPGMASGYFGDYLGIAAYDEMVYPCWTDNRIGYAMTYVSPIDFHLPSSMVVYSNDFINDTLSGNGNGKMDFGDTILLGLDLINNGDLEADSIFVTLSTDSPYILFEDSTEYYGNFNIGESITILDAFQFSVSDYIPDGYLVNFQVTAVSALDTSTTISYFSIEAHAPAITILGMSIDDASGNNNHRLDPGESVTIHFLTENTGEYDALDVVSTLEASNPFVTVTDDRVELGTLLPGEVVNASFPVTISDACPIGSATVFHNVATWELGMDELYKTVRIGLIVEDWETGNFQKFPWTFYGSADWVIDPNVKWEGNYSARSGDITDSDTSGLAINYHVLLDDTISFYHQISSELIFDKLNFFIDELLVGSWSGDSAWKFQAYPVLAGPHVFKWEYVKNENTSQFNDHAWIDYIVFPPEYKLAATAGPDGTVCAGTSYQIQSAAIAFDSVRWITSGTGTFDDPTRYNPVYAPSPEDIAAGSVVLTITAYGEAGSTVTDEMILTIETPPQAYAGPDASGCSAGYTLSGATASAYGELMWTSTGDGTFSDVHLLTPTYFPGEQDVAAGSVELQLIAGGTGICEPAEDGMTLTIFLTPVIDLGPDTTICANLMYTLDATTEGAASYLWSPGGETTPTITVDSSSVGIGSQTWSVMVTSLEGCEGSGEVSVTFKDCTGINELAKKMTLSVYPNPNDGSFTIKLSSRSTERVNIRIIGTGGVTVFEVQDIDVNGEIILPVTMENLPQGSYLLEVSNESGKAFSKVVVSK
ncbi:MAG: T9SS C-terminal target domain-containing protein [Bacteroidetes bacterium]|nr:MAG: T9SS C-terminal target domain-containing protein [Bacteroidota bacterium]